MGAWTTIADIDAGIPVIRAKRDQARIRGDYSAADIHEAWMNRLLEARQHRTFARPALTQKHPRSEEQGC